MKDHHAEFQEWSTRYEQLRQAWLEPLRGWGQSVFIRGGMIAWLKYCLPAESTEASSTDGASESRATRPIIASGDLQRQLTCELANLILHRQQEVVA
jgi:hypothetical protein